MFYPLRHVAFLRARRRDDDHRLQRARQRGFRPVNLLRPGDIAVTQDYGLAAMCLARNAAAIGPDGLYYTNANIDALLMQRHAAKKVRMAGGRLRGNAKRAPEQDVRFERALAGLIRSLGQRDE